MKFVKIKKVRSPSRGTDQSAGIDFFVPEFDDEIKEKLKDFKFGSDEQGNYVVLKSLERILIPSGIKTYMKSGRMLMAANKSGIASKKGLIVGAAIIDSDYQQEVHISLINVSKESVKIYENDKIVQFIETPVYLDFVEEISEENFISYHKNSERTGGFGSTGN